VLTQTAPFGMYGFGQMTGWPQYPVAPQLLHAYQQDPYGILARQAWVTQTQATNPWVIQALLGELAATIARQGAMGLGHMGLGHMGPGHLGLGHLGLGSIGLAGLPLGAGIGQVPFGAIGQLPLGPGIGPVPFGAGPVNQLWGTPFGQGSYGFGTGAGIGNGVIGGVGTAVPFPAAAGAWSMPTMAMV
jgi:hypothetical protein